MTIIVVVFFFFFFFMQMNLFFVKLWKQPTNKPHLCYSSGRRLIKGNCTCSRRVRHFFHSIISSPWHIPDPWNHLSLHRATLSSSPASLWRSSRRLPGETARWSFDYQRQHLPERQQGGNNQPDDRNFVLTFAVSPNQSVIDTSITTEEIPHATLRLKIPQVKRQNFSRWLFTWKPSEISGKS